MQLNLFVSSFSFKACILLTGLALALVSGSQSNNPPQISPAILLPGDSTIDAAVGTQTSPQIASGANGFLAVWQDNRSQIMNSFGLSTCGLQTGSGSGSNNDIYAARLDADGQLISPTPIILTQTPTCQTSPSVAWNGQNWLVVWTSQRDVPFGSVLEGVRVSPSGQVLDQSAILISQNAPLGSNIQLTSDGANWTVIWSGGAINGAIVAPNGTVDALGTKLIYFYPDPLPPTVQVNADIAFAENEYLLVWNEVIYLASGQVTSMLKTLRLNRQLSPVSTLTTLLATGAGRPSVATDGQKFLVAMGRIGWLIGNDGQIISSQLPLTATGGAVDVCWDGMNYYISGYKENSTVFAAKLAPNGLPMENNEVELKRFDNNFFVAMAPKLNGGTQVVWATQKIYKPYTGAEISYYSPESDVLTAGMTAYGTATTALTVSVGAPRQSLARLAAGAEGFLLTYRSQVSGDSRIMAMKLNADGNPTSAEPIRLDGGYPGITNPAVAWNGMFYLAVWENSEEPTGEMTTQQGTIYGMRLNADGTLLDAAPFRISKGKDATVAALNGEFLVVSSYQFDGSAVATRVNSNGQVTQSFIISPSTVGLSGKIGLPSVATIGNRWLMVWTGIDSLGCNCVWESFINLQGDVTSAVKLSGPLGDCHPSSWGLEPQIASSGNSAQVVYRGRSTAITEFDLLLTGGISARKINADGTFADQSDRGFLISPQGYVPSVAWDGFGFLVNWLDPRNALHPRLSSGDIFATRIGANGSIVDGEGFALADSPLPEDKPAVAANNGISIFAWSGFNTTPQAAMRIYLRSLRGAFILQPTAPSTLYNTGSGWDHVSLRWTDNSTNEDGFKIERCAGENCTDFVEIATVTANTTSFLNNDLPGRTWYRYRVRAFNLGGISAYSNIETTLTGEAPSFSLTGRLTDRDGRGLESYSVTLTGSQGGFARTDRSGYYRLSSIAGGGNYRVTVQSPGPRIGFTTYYPNPGWVEFNYLTSNQTANFIYNLTSPWIPPGATPTPTPTPLPTPTPTPPPSGNDATILNPNFDLGGTHWTASGAVSFANGIVRLTPTTNYSPASIFQWVPLTPGATYEVSADITASATTRLTFGVKFDQAGNIINGPSVPYTNVTRPTNVRVSFIVPSGIGQVGFFVQANGSVSSNSLATTDNFRLVRVN